MRAKIFAYLNGNYNDIHCVVSTLYYLAISPWLEEKDDLAFTKITCQGSRFNPRAGQNPFTKQISPSAKLYNSVKVVDSFRKQ